MTSSLVPSTGQVLVTAGVFAALFGAVVILAVLWLRARWSRLQRLLARRLQNLALDAAAAGWRWFWARPRHDYRWRSLHRVRRDLAQSLAGAEQAVAIARSSGAPLGELASLCRRLRSSAGAVDSSLRIAQRGPATLEEGQTAGRQATELAAAARRIQSAAAMAVAGSSDLVTGMLLDDVDRETTALTSAASSPAARIVGAGNL